MNKERVSVPRKAVDWLLEATNELDLPFAIKDPLALLFGGVQPLPSPHPETLEVDGMKYQRVEWDGTVYADAMILTPQPNIIPTNGRTAGAVTAYMEVGCAQYRPIPKPKAVEVSATADESGWFWDRELSALQEAVKATGYVGMGKLRFIPEGAEEGK